MTFQSLPIGDLHQEKDFLFFFGNKESNQENLKKQFPDLEFIRLKQVHGDGIVDSAIVSTSSTPVTCEADAHFSRKIHQALISVTADCVPILIFDRQEKIVAAIHAGWRGVANQIFLKTLKRLQQMGSQPENLRVAIGPHIQMNSFEVGKDVKEQILSSIGPSGPEHFIDIGDSKSKVSLAAVLCSQLRIFYPRAQPDFVSTADTFRSPDLHSFRRDSKSAGRQLSFVALL